ncbi:MAG: hypothetical protein QG652_180, partial [Pseudomonadota bacterium]|nr:hypothetical protein [Pseudomonadota bacterium]
MINAKTLSLAGILLIGLSQGCTMVQTYPIAARA